LGLSNGKLYYYRSKNIDKKSIFGKLKDKSKDSEFIEVTSPNSHKGEIRKILYSKINEN
jgi:hypothetical protein